VSYQENLALVKSCSFGVSPTLIENFGMSILEAHACGVPMVSFDVGGNSDIVRHGRNGMLVPYLDIEGLVRAACRLMDETNRAAMSRNAKEDAATRFRTEVVVEQILTFMDKVRA
jgi:glycosyltransferase involved in cell wall biosynthesis